MATCGRPVRKVLARIALVLALCGCLVWLFTHGSLEALVILLVTFAALLSELS